MPQLKRFWIEFHLNNHYSLGLGCGVTAWNYNDALNILKEKIFKNDPPPLVKKVIEDIDVSTLDTGHVLPNMLPPNIRGVWYPLGYNY
jgi:hypothetical protein